MTTNQNLVPSAGMADADLDVSSAVGAPEADQTAAATAAVASSSESSRGLMQTSTAVIDAYHRQVSSWLSDEMQTVSECILKLKKLLLPPEDDLVSRLKAVLDAVEVWSLAQRVAAHRPADGEREETDADGGAGDIPEPRPACGRGAGVDVPSSLDAVHVPAPHRCATGTGRPRSRSSSSGTRPCCPGTMRGRARLSTTP